MWNTGPNQRDNEEEKGLLYRHEIGMEQDLKQWDLFQDPPRKTKSGSMADAKFFDAAEKVMKLIAYIITFAVVLSAAVISKGTLLFMTSQVSNNTKPYCNKNLGSNKQLVVNLPPIERVVWIWMLFYAFCVPQFGTFIRSLRICLFKSWTLPTVGDFILLVITETLPSIGSAIMVYCVLPELDVIKGAMLTNAICFIPAITALLTRDPACSVSSLKLILDVTSIAAQVTSFVVWPLVENKPTLWLIPVAVILISCGWWENYVSEKTPISFLKGFAHRMKEFQNSRYFMYVFVSLWKCLVFFISMVVIYEFKEGNVRFLFDHYKAAMNAHWIHIDEIKPVINLDNVPNIAKLIEEGTGTNIKTDFMTPVWVFLINVLSSYLCYVFGKFACKIMIQGFSFAFPLNLATPVAISGLIAMTSKYAQDNCAFAEAIPPYLFFDSPPIYMLKDFIAHEQSWIWLIWVLSQAWITIHIWTPTCERQARTEKLFMRPMYDPFFIDQDVALNRRREDKSRLVVEDAEDDVVNIGEDFDMSNDNTTKIYACGTMWRENGEEMLEFLKSIMRLDEDQSARRLVRQQMGIFDMDDYYELETHVFFDDAFVAKTNQINEYVKQLIVNINEAATNVHEVQIEVRPPKKYTTPYGGRLVWTLPGKTQLFVHLKDAAKIRRKKRWSQVMYMYYLLGHRLLERDISSERKEVIAENTYILALDGDIDFQPKAVSLLVDLMKKRRYVGAACGRIHPIGSGPMVWYQMFEYAVGHWLQKATEHMIGCVLCSPGCFSLFRGKALMDYNVMKKYTTVPSQAKDFVQYDQGEDRWLCTLLLQRGYRVEYSAASDAFTHCPEGFDEFYKQRRRWMPSTTANILDLLMDYKHTISVNDNISRLYIGYQVILMVGTILGPGTIFLMLVGAFVAAFQLDQWSSFLWNIVPILIFIIVCKLFKSDDVQLFFAGVISGIYGLVMMAVLVGIMLQIHNDGLLAPSSLFFFCVAGEMIVTALLHPKEINCLPYGIVYYVTVPSMYMLLVIYTVFNMNNISWGTRDAGVKKEEENAKKEPEKKEKKEQNVQEKLMSLFKKTGEDDSGSFECSIAGLFRCMMCTHEVRPVERYQLEEIKVSMNAIMKKLDNLSRGVEEEEPQPQPTRRRTMFLEGTQGFEKKEVEENVSDDDDDLSNAGEVTTWLDDKLLQKAAKSNLSNEEVDFWNGLLDKYLHPIEETDDEKKKIFEDLSALRDKSVAAFFMLNSLFVLVVFLLTLKKDLLHINWPFDVKANFTYYPDSDQIIMTKNYLQLEPIGLVFLFFFAILLIVQFIAMLFHRFNTLCQILSNTVINWSLFKSNVNEMTPDEIVKHNAVEIAKHLQKLKDDGIKKKLHDPVERRKTVANILNNNKTRAKVNFLDDAYERRVTHFKLNPNKFNGPVKKETMAALQRRTTMVQQRKSMVRPSGLSGGNVNHAFEG